MSPLGLFRPFATQQSPVVKIESGLIIAPFNVQFIVIISIFCSETRSPRKKRENIKFVIIYDVYNTSEHFPIHSLPLPLKKIAVVYFCDSELEVIAGEVTTPPGRRQSWLPHVSKTGIFG